MGASGNKEAPTNFSSNLDKINEKSNQTLPSQTNAELKMPAPNTFRCDRCGMTFSNDEALYKHRIRFCIGQMETPKERHVYYSDDEQFNNRSTMKRVIHHQTPAERKRDEINEWKNQRSVLQSVQDMEDRIARDSQKTQRLANDLKKRTYEYNHILTEYEQLQAHERDLLRQMFNLQDQAGSNFNQPHHLTENEKNQFELLQKQNARLEQERRIIQNRLEELIAHNHQISPVSDYEPYKLLRDMKEEQDRNEKALIYLRRRLVHPDSDIPTLPYMNSYQRTANDYLRFLPYRSLHSSDRTNDLGRRLYQYEYYPWLRDYPEPLKRYPYDPVRPTSEDLLVSKRENQRLQDELDYMERRFQKLDTRTRQLELVLAHNRLIDINPTSHTSHNQTHINSHENFADLYRSYQQTNLPSVEKYNNNNNTSQATQSLTRINTNMNRLRDPLAPQPYDPIGGFVIFFDFILNLPPNIDRCRLITCLHDADSGLGEPSQLQPLKCDLFTDEKTGERMSLVLIATKQPVVGCPPQQNLSIVIEFQLINKQIPNDSLRTQAWTKIPLFDQRNRVISGRWKAPLKSLPIRQNENYFSINSFPSFAHAELYYRLVNSHDVPEQSQVTLTPSLRDLYFFPPQYRDRTYL